MKITEERGFDRVIEASGNRLRYCPAWTSWRSCGRIVLFGIYPSHYKLTVDIDKLYFKEAGIQTVFGQSHLFPRAVNILPKLDLKSDTGARLSAREMERGHGRAQYHAVCQSADKVLIGP